MKTKKTTRILPSKDGGLTIALGAMRTLQEALASSATSRNSVASLAGVDPRGVAASQTADSVESVILETLTEEEFKLMESLGLTAQQLRQLQRDAALNAPDQSGGESQ